MPSLYVVATPIGNLEDITLRAIRTLKEVKLIAAEDTRKTRQLLSAYNIKTPLTSYHEHNKLTKLDYVLEKLETDDIALVSDAGMPGISDPGFELISAAIQHNVTVIPIPGPSVLVTALIVSGLATTSFIFLGFLPHKTGERRRLLDSISDEKRTLVFFESPHRASTALQNILEILGDRKIAICRELTKFHEEIFRGTVSEAIERFTEPRGEFTLVISGKAETSRAGVEKDTLLHLKQMQGSGVTVREAITQLSAESGLSRKELYRAWIKISKE
jgi:16S rRNA (cytidine1402-2'-O)-methyltransferase